MTEEETFEERIARALGESARDLLRRKAIEAGLDPDKVLANLNLHSFIGPDLVDPFEKG